MLLKYVNVLKNDAYPFEFSRFFLLLVYALSSRLNANSMWQSVLKC